jgi:LmbE family N-acetylglucosaminyl deacetylase
MTPNDQGRPLALSFRAKQVPCVFLSPHADDICFSLAGFIVKWRPTGVLVTVFTQSTFAPGARFAAVGRCERQRVVSRQRELEDQRFAAEAGLLRQELAFAERALRGGLPFGAIDRDTLVAVSKTMVRALVEVSGGLLIPAEERPILFAPLAVGDHSDHVTVLHSVLAAYPLLAKHFDVAFYEDLPYANDRDAAARAVERVNRALKGVLHIVHRQHMDRGLMAAKERLMGMYASQVGVFPPERMGLDELVWCL